MKKIIGIIGVIAFAMVLFTNTNSTNANTNLDLADLMNINEANAECFQGHFIDGKCSLTGNCYWSAGGVEECSSHL